MAMQIANPVVIEKIERLAGLTGLNKTAAVEVAVDRLLEEAVVVSRRDEDRRRVDAILRQLHALPDLPGAVDPLEWDENGLPA